MSDLRAVIPPAAKSLGPLRANYLYARTVLTNVAHRLLLRRRRHRDQVASDYDSGEWAQQKAAGRWSEVPSLEAYADKQWLDQRIVAEMEGRLWDVPAADYYRFRRQKLIEIIGQYDLGSETVIELGSGTGSNLFALATSDRWRHVVGLELSPTGREVTREIVERFGLEDRIEVGHIDLLQPGSDGFARLAGAVCFTHYCLEQLPDDTEAVFRSLVDAGIRRAILIEPSFELLSPISLKDQASRTYVLRQDYQRTIVSVAQKLQAEGLIRIAAVGRLDFVSSCRNAPTLLVWDNTRVASSG